MTRVFKQPQNCYLPPAYFEDGVFNRLTKGAHKVYCVLRRHADPYGITEMTIGAIVKKCGFGSRDTVYRAMAELEARGLLHERMKPNPSLRASIRRGRPQNTWLFYT